MSTFKTEGLVLVKKQLKAADRLYILYTRDYGKIEAKVRSAASAKSKLAGHLEPISLSQLMIAKGKNLETIAGAKLIKHYSFANFGFQSRASIAGELVLKVIKNNLAQGEVFELLKSFLESLDQKFKILDQSAEEKAREAQFLSLRFIWRLLTHLGYKINLNSNSWPALSTLSLESKELLKNCLAAKSELTNLRYSFKVIRELAHFTQEYLRYFLEIDLKSFYPSFYAKQF